MAPMAALSLMVSTMVRPGISTRASRISSAGTTRSVARSTSVTVTPGPSSGSASTNASSTSTRTFEYRACSTTLPDSSTMSSKMTP